MARDLQFLLFFTSVPNHVRLLWNNTLHASPIERVVLPRRINPADNPARIYFNFDRDTLYLEETWTMVLRKPRPESRTFVNWLTKRTCKGLKPLASISTRIFVIQPGFQTTPWFLYWNGLKASYLGLEEPWIGPDSHIEFHELQSKDCEAFTQDYIVEIRVECGFNFRNRYLDDAATVDKLLPIIRIWIRN